MFETYDKLISKEAFNEVVLDCWEKSNKLIIRYPMPNNIDYKVIIEDKGNNNYTIIKDNVEEKISIPYLKFENFVEEEINFIKDSWEKEGYPLIPTLLEKILKEYSFLKSSFEFTPTVFFLEQVWGGHCLEIKIPKVDNSLESYFVKFDKENKIYNFISRERQSEESYNKAEHLVNAVISTIGYRAETFEKLAKIFVTVL